MQLYHLKMAGFEKFLKSCRSQNVDSVESVAKITLPFQVHTHMSEKYHLGWSDITATIVHVGLRKHEESYGVVMVMGRRRYFSKFGLEYFCCWIFTQTVPCFVSNE